MAGGIEFNEGKFKELIVYIARRLGPEAALGRVKLAKLLMQSDFGAYGRSRTSITGATYEKWEHGHLPRQLLLAERDLEAEGAIAGEDVDYFGKRLHQITARRDPDLSDFTEDELAVVESALRQFGYESATHLSDLSHLEHGWRLTELKEAIPYNTVFLGAGGVTDADLRRGEELAGEKVEFGPMPGERWEEATVLEDEPEPKVEVRIRYPDQQAEQVRVRKWALYRTDLLNGWRVYQPGDIASRLDERVDVVELDPVREILNALLDDIEPTDIDTYKAEFIGTWVRKARALLASTDSGETDARA